MNFSLYQAEDFASDESFIAYHLKTDEAAIVFWEDWISRNPEKLDEILNAEQLIDALSLRLPENDFTMEFNRFEDFLKKHPTEAVNADQKPNRFNGKKLVLILSIFLLTSIAGIFFYNQQKNTRTPLTYATRYNGHGKISIIWLADGTKVTLNANSALTFPKKFAKNKRDVKLVGEAFFEVAKDKSRPFTVEANGTKTRVLGTKFNVSAYQNGKDIRVALMEGSVKFSDYSGQNGTLLKPNEMAVFSKLSKKLSKRNFNVEEIYGWTKGILAFNNASFEEIQTKFMNLYGIKLIDHTASKTWNYTGRFNQIDYLSIIKSICFSKNLTFNQSDQTITLNSKK